MFKILWEFKMTLDLGYKQKNMFQHSKAVNAGLGKVRIGQATVVVAKDGTEDTDDIQTALNILKEKVLEEISQETWIIKAYDSSNTGLCIKIEKPSSLLENENLIVFGSSNEIIPSKIEGGYLLAEGGNGYMKLIYSNLSFEGNQELSLSSCVEIEPKNMVKEKRVFENKILSLVSESESNYSNLKQSLGISSSIEFDVSFEYLNQTIIGENSNKPDLDIYSESEFLNYLGLEGIEKIGRLILKVW